MTKPVVVVVAREQSYLSGELRAAADRLDVELVFASDRCHILAEKWPSDTIAIDFRNGEGAADLVATAVDRERIVATLGTDEPTAVAAEEMARCLGVPTGLDGAAARAADKLLTRKALTAAGLRQPRFVESLVDDGSQSPPFPFPVVVKPRCLSASRGVISADGLRELDTVRERVRQILTDSDVRGRFGSLADSMIIEELVPGPEIAVDGVLVAGELTPIAVFDKPRPLDGPTFPESLYITPTGLSPADRNAAIRATEEAATALGLREGPIHAELRLGWSEPVVIEVAARTIGGLCGRSLSLTIGYSVAEVALASLARIPIAPLAPSPVGVAMLCPSSAGVFVGIDGVESASKIDGIESIEITAKPGQNVQPVPDGSDYLGFVFARGRTTDEVIDRLTKAESLLRAEIRSVL